MSDDEQGTEAVNDERQGTARVVLRGVRAVALDGLSADEQRAVLAAAGKSEVVLPLLWEATALRHGTVEVAIKTFAGQSGREGNKPGTYRAVPEGSWGVSPLVIEPPLG